MSTQEITNDLVGLVFIIISMILSVYCVFKFVKELPCNKESKEVFVIFLCILIATRFSGHYRIGAETSWHY